MRSLWKPTVVLAAAMFGSVSWVAIAQGPQGNRTVADRVYTSAQAQRGKALYDVQCAACHGATLGGGLAPPLAGADFLRVWNGRPLAELVDKIQHTMPLTSPGTLSPAQATDLVAYMLAASGFPAGQAELTGPAILTQVRLVAPGGAAPAAATPRAPAGTLASVKPAAVSSSVSPLLGWPE